MMYIVIGKSHSSSDKDQHPFLANAGKGINAKHSGKWIYSTTTSSKNPVAEAEEHV
jgi:hypothetical protein